MVPGVHCDSNGVFGFRLGSFESVWDGVSVFLCFCDVE
jgi:hypothetical protein